MLKPRLLPAIMMTVIRAVCLAWTLTFTLAPGPAGAAEPPSLNYRFPEHPRCTTAPVAMSPATRAKLAKAKVGATRLEVARALMPASGSMISPIDSFFDEKGVSIPYKSIAFHIDCVFQPVSMNDAQYAAAKAQEDELRRTGKWPSRDIHDVLRAVSRPYLAPIAEWWVLETCGLPPSARRRLQRLHVGMTRREVLREFEPANEGVFPPSEPWHVRHVIYRDSQLMIEIDFKPAAMDPKTYADPVQRTAWFRAHPWFPGDDLNDTVMDFYKPRREGGAGPAIEISRLPAVDRDQLRNLRVGMSRNELLRTFPQIVCEPIPPAIEGGGGGALSLEFHVILARGPLWHPKAQVRVDLKFESALTCNRSNPSGGRDGQPAWEFSRPLLTRVAGSDVLVGFSRPYVYLEKWIVEDRQRR